MAAVPKVTDPRCYQENQMNIHQPITLQNQKSMPSRHRSSDRCRGQQEYFKEDRGKK
jgi:hypothetical protein